MVRVFFSRDVVDRNGPGSTVEVLVSDEYVPPTDGEYVCSDEADDRGGAAYVSMNLVRLLGADLQSGESSEFEVICRRVDDAAVQSRTPSDQDEVAKVILRMSHRMLDLFDEVQRLRGACNDNRT